MSLERNAHVRIVGNLDGFSSLFAAMRQAERLALQVQQPVAMNADGSVRPARRSDHVWGHAIDLPPGIGRQLRRPPSGDWTRATRRGERRRVARQLRETARDRRTEAAIRRRHASITRGDAWYRGTAPDLTRGARP